MTLETVTMNAAPAEDAAQRMAKPVLCFIGASDIRLWSLTPAERLRRQFAREGVTQEISFAAAGQHAGPVIFLKADAILDQPLIPILAQRSHVLIIGSTGQTSAPLAV